MKISDLPPQYQKQIHDQDIAKTRSMASRVQVPVMECPVFNDALAAPRNAKERSPCIRARITLFTRRPLDDCNLSTKGIIDCIRYAGIIIDDNWGNLQVVPEQRKVEKESEEGTLIEIEEIKTTIEIEKM